MAGEEIQSQLPKGPAGTTGASEGPDGTLQYHDVSGKVLGAVPGDNGGAAADDIDLSAGMVPKDDGLDLSAGMVPKSAPPTVRPALPGGLAGAAIGFGKGVLQTTSGIGEMIQKIPVIGPKIIPQEGLALEEAASKPEGLAQNVGSLAEAGAEYAGGEELLAGMTRLAKLEKLAKNSEVINGIIKNTPDWVRRVVSSGTVGAAQGATKGAAEGDAASGAAQGALGGTLGSAAGELAAGVIKPVANKLGIYTSAEEDALKAFQPSKNDRQFIQNWDAGKDRIVKEIGEDGNFKDWGDAADRLRGVRQDLWANEVKPKIDAHAGEDMFMGQTGNPVADAIRARITPAMQRVSPSSAKAIETFAKRFEGPMKVGEAEELAEQINAELKAEDYFKKSPSERAALDKAKPQIAARSAAVDAIRNSLADHLEAAGETGIKDLKKEYGAISSLENYARGRINVDGRARPISLKQMVAAGAGLAHGGVGGAVAGVAMPLADKMFNEPIALLNRAAAKTAPSAARSAVNKVVGGTVENLGRVGSNVGAQIPQAAKATFSTGTGDTSGDDKPWIRFRSSNGGEFEGHPDEWEKIVAADPGAKKIE